MSKLAGLLIGILLFSLIVLGTNTFITGMNENYNINITEEGWEETYDYTQNISSTAKNMQDILEDKNTNWLISGLQMGYSVLKLTFRAPLYVVDIISNLGNNIGLPEWATTYVITILVILITFIVLGALVRWYL